jgi:uncharacterized protein (TIGR04552 family)
MEEKGNKLQLPDYKSALDVITPATRTIQKIRRKLFILGIDVKTANGEQYALDLLSKAIDCFEYLYSEDPTKNLAKSLNSSRKIEDLYSVFLTASGKLDYPRTRIEHVADACTLLRLGLLLSIIRRSPYLLGVLEAAEEVEKIFKNKFVKRKHQGQTIYEFTPGQIIDEAATPTILNINNRIKTEESLAIKLLKRAEADPNEVMDVIGIEILTASKRDSLLLIHLLLTNPETAIFPIEGVRIKEIKNLLITPEQIREMLEGTRSSDEFVAKISQENLFAKKQGLIDLKNKESGKEYTDLIHLVIDVPVQLPSGKRLWVPIEIQIKDVARKGKIEKTTPSTVYKADQKSKARRRTELSNLSAAFKRYELEQEEKEEKLEEEKRKKEEEEDKRKKRKTRKRKARIRRKNKKSVTSQ